MMLRRRTPLYRRRKRWRWRRRRGLRRRIRRRALAIPRRRGAYVKFKFESWNSFWVSQVPQNYSCQMVKDKKMASFFEWNRLHWSWTLQDHMNQSGPPSQLFQYYKITKVKLQFIPQRSSGTQSILPGYTYIDRVNKPDEPLRWDTTKWFPDGTNNYTKRSLKTTTWHTRIFRPTVMLTAERHSEEIPAIQIPGLENWWFQRKQPWITTDDWAVIHLGMWSVFGLDTLNQMNPPKKDEGDDTSYIHNPLKVRMNSKSTVYVTFKGQL